MELSILVPCHNEESSLPELSTRILAVLSEAGLQPHDYEVILIDDGSADSTARLIDDVCSRLPQFRGILFSRNFGKEAAMLAGLRAAQGDYALIMDADLQHPVELVPTLLRAIKEQPVEQVIAKRDRKGDGARRTFVSRTYYRAVNALIDVKLEDGAGDFRIISRVAVNALLSLPEVNRFSKGLFSWIGFPVAVIEYENVSRSGGQSSWSTKSLINYGIDGVVSFNSKPLRIIIYLGAAIFGLAVLYLVFLLIQYLAIGVTTPGYVTTVAVIILFGGFQLFSLGIMGEYVGRIYQESKRRPQYLVYKTLGSLSETQR